jgi:hypothetical protein
MAPGAVAPGSSAQRPADARLKTRPHRQATSAADAVTPPEQGGRQARQEQAQGILVAALGMLAGHLGYGEANQAS